MNFLVSPINSQVLMKHTTSLPIQTFPITINESPLMINHKRCSQYKKTQNPTQIAHNPFESANE